MKSFSQFLNESYFNEEEARQGSLMTRSGKPQDFRNPKKTPFTATDPTPTPASRRLSAGAPEAPKVSPGQQVIRQTSNPSTAKALPPGNTGGKLAKPINAIPDAMGKGAQDAARKQASNPKPPSGGKPPTGLPPSGAKPTVKPTVPTAKPTGVKGLRGIGGKALGVAAAALEGGIEYKSQRDKGRTRVGSLGGASSAVGGGFVGAKGGALTGAKLGSILGPKGAAAGAVIGGIGGYVAGSELGKKAFNTVAGATGKEKAAMATTNRQRQAGTAVKGIGGSTSFSQKKSGGPAFMSTGSGAQRKTVQLAKTGVVQRGGQSVAGNLAFKGGKAVYKAGPSAQSLAKTSSNPLERVGRSLFAGAYKKSDAANAAKKLATARQSDAARNLKLGVKAKPAG